MMYGFIWMLVIVNVVTALSPENETLKFLAKGLAPEGIPIDNYHKNVLKGVWFVFNCTTNDPDAVVNLEEKAYQSPYENSSKVKGERIKRFGNNQMFNLTETTSDDSRTYQCTAENDHEEISLELVALLVGQHNVKLLPEIYPSQPSGEKLLIEMGAEFSIHCKTLGYVGKETIVVEWYRLMSHGKKKLNGVHTDEQSGSNIIIDVVDYTFTNFQKSDAGTYVCVKSLNSTQGQTYVTEDQIVVDLEPPTAPEVTFPDYVSADPIVFVNVSKHLNIYCDITGSPNPKKTWLKGTTLLRDCEGKKCILSLSSVKHPKDSGVYTCVGENLISKTQKNITVIVQVPVKINKPTPIYEATFKENKMLICEISQGNPPPKITWKSQVDTCEQGVGSDSCNPLDNEWEDVDQADQDAVMRSTIVSEKKGIDYFYRCIAENSFSKDIYQFKLIRNDRNPVLFDFKGTTKLLYENDVLNLACSIDTTFYNSAVISKIGQKELLRTNDVTVGSTKTITYTQQVAEVTDEGNYSCQAKHKRGGVENKYLYVVVNKLQAPIIYNFDNITVNQDDIITKLQLFCNVSGNPQPKITWKYNGNRIYNQNRVKDINSCINMVTGIYLKTDKDDTLILCGLDYRMHSGMYECSAMNKVETVTQQMYLSIEASPKIIDSSWDKKRIFGLGDIGKIKCEVSANPPANVTWEKINGNETYVIKTGDLESSVLKFDGLTGEDSGLYRCKAVNRFSSIHKDVYVEVRGNLPRPVIFLASSKGTIIGIICAFVIILIIVIIIVFLYQRRLKKRCAKRYLEPNEDFQLDKDRTLFEQSSELPYDMEWEYPRDKLTFIKTLGSGAFGQVWLAEAEGIHSFKPRDTGIDARKRRKSIRNSKRYQRMSFRYKKTTQRAEMSLEKSMVAVKLLKEDAAEGEYKDLASELKILIHLGEHKNIVNLLGACTTGGKLCVILEYCPHGNLLNFLRSHRETFDPVWKKHQTDMEKEFTYIDLLMIAYQVGKGMDFLQSRKCVHRDLAARNVLVGDGYVMKIADFGLARDIYKDDIYTKQTNSLLPLKWMAPESLFDKVYTSSSDVWSFGILLWEIYSLGCSPYPGLPIPHLSSFIKDGKRMDCPDNCPKDVYTIMYDCWTKRPCERPLFAQLVKRLNNIMKQNVSEGDVDGYLDFFQTTTQAGYIDLVDNTTNNLKRGVSSEYLEATASDTKHPKGDCHVPLLAEVVDNDNDVEHEANVVPVNSLLLPTPPSEDYN